MIVGNIKIELARAASAQPTGIQNEQKINEFIPNAFSIFFINILFQYLAKE
jgi:hypothetical protein